MPEMRDFAREAWDAATHRHHPTPPTPATITEGHRMSLSTDIHRIGTVLETIGEDGLTALEAVAANPEATTVLKSLAAAAGLSLPTGWIITAADILDALGKPAQAQQQPAPPQVMA
jgi:hypothetical protein